MARVSDQERRLRHRFQYYGRPGAVGSALFAASVVSAAVLALAACGSGERTFSAQEFVDEANSNGAHLALGEPLGGEQADAQIYALRVEPVPSGGAAPTLGEGAGSGSLRVEGSSDAAEGEYARCNQAGLFCYRAANVVLVFEADVDPGSLVDLVRAIRALKAD